MNDLEAAFNKVVNEFKKEVNEALDSACQEVADEAEQKLHESSPVLTGYYAKGWTVTKKAGSASYEVHNATDYQLTHLLEKGHDIVVNGKKVGHAKPRKHIKKVERWIQQELPKRLEEKLQ